MLNPCLDVFRPITCETDLLVAVAVLIDVVSQLARESEERECGSVDRGWGLHIGDAMGGLVVMASEPIVDVWWKTSVGQESDRSADQTPLSSDRAALACDTARNTVHCR